MNHKVDRREFLCISAPVAALWSLPLPCVAGAPEYDKDGFTLWQLASQTPIQMMSYVIKTTTGKIMVFDGGNTGDANYLRGFLGALGNHVDAWFISHAHDDHFDAVTTILNEPAGISIDRMYGSLPSEDWIEKYEPSELGPAQAFNGAVKKSGHEVLELTPGQIILFDNITIEILAVKNPEITTNAINNSSVVMRISAGNKAIIFTGDLGAEGGRKLMQSPYRSRLQAEYVQMAHHGQNGVDEEFYRAVAPRYCLWPTPRWLWDNDNGGGKGSGPWRTLEVRAWMDKHSITHHYVSADGLIRMEL